MTIGISELQKNISIFKNLQNDIEVLDKKSNKILAIILPNKKHKISLTDTLAGSLQHKTDIKVDNLKDAISQAYQEEMSKYE